MKSLAHLPIQERSQTAEARRIAVHFAQRMGVDEVEAGRVAIVATELANNLLNHANGGELVVSGEGGSLDILSIDRGPGMSLLNSLQDGYSTAGTPGTGLGAIQRLTPRFDAFSSPEGTVLLAGFGSGIRGVGCVRVPIKGETVCGDSWSVKDRDGSRWILVADGLGHGPLAAEAADRAVEVFETSQRHSVSEVVEEIHSGLRSTRGASVAVARIQGGEVSFCGLGNIGAVIQSGLASTHMVSLNGTAGLQARKISPFTYSYSPGAVVILHSDGLQTHWGLERYPGILRKDPAVLAGLLYRDFSRGRDDITVLVAQQ